MKNFTVKVIDRKTKEVLEDHTELYHSEKKLREKYQIRYRFHKNLVSIKIDRLVREPGKQLDLEDMIKACEAEDGA